MYYLSITHLKKGKKNQKKKNNVHIYTYTIIKVEKDRRKKKAGRSRGRYEKGGVLDVGKCKGRLKSCPAFLPFCRACNEMCWFWSLSSLFLPFPRRNLLHCLPKRRKQLQERDGFNATANCTIEPLQNWMPPGIWCIFLPFPTSLTPPLLLLPLLLQPHKLQMQLMKHLLLIFQSMGAWRLPMNMENHRLLSSSLSAATASSIRCRRCLRHHRGRHPTWPTWALTSSFTFSEEETINGRNRLTPRCDIENTVRNGCVLLTNNKDFLCFIIAVVVGKCC